MNIETKTLGGEYFDYTKFGWKHTKSNKVRHGKHSYIEHVLERDRDMPNYSSVVALERKYFSLKSQLKTYDPMEPLVVFVSFICLIIPFIIYVSYKSNQKKQIESHNSNIRRQMDDIKKEASALLQA